MNVVRRAASTPRSLSSAWGLARGHAIFVQLCGRAMPRLRVRFGTRFKIKGLFYDNMWIYGFLWVFALGTIVRA